MNRSQVTRVGALALLVGGIAAGRGAVPAAADTPAISLGSCTTGSAATTLPIYLELTGAVGSVATPVYDISTGTVTTGSGAVIPISSGVTNAPGGTAAADVTGANAAVGGNVLSSAAGRQVGFVDYAQGINRVLGEQSSPVAQPGTPNEPSALFTFVTNETPVAGVAIDAVGTATLSGTFTVYLANGVAAHFNNTGSFGLGTPILTANVSEQITPDANALTQGGPFGLFSGRSAPSLILSVLGAPATTTATATATTGSTTRPPYVPQSTLQFNSVSTNTITSTSSFSVNGTCYQFGTTGQQFTTYKSGLVTGQSVLSGGYFGVATSAITSSASTTSTTSASS